MSKITLLSGNIAAFTGDAIICPCDMELTNKNANPVIESVFKQAGADLLTELAAVGYCELDNVVITKGYKLKAKHIIFLPYKDDYDPKNKTDYLLLHQAFKAAFSLARLYGIKSLAISLPRIKAQKRNLLEQLRDAVLGHEPEARVETLEMIDIVTATAKEKGSALEEAAIYR